MCDVAWFFGDPHIHTLDNADYTFNGLGEFTMLRFIHGDGFELQARTGRAFNNESQPLDTGTVFIGFAASRGTTTVGIFLGIYTIQMKITASKKWNV